MRENLMTAWTASARRLEVDLVPAALHGKAPRTLISRKSWAAVSAFVRSDGACVFCGSGKNPHAHERYEIEGDAAHLAEIVHVCEACHNVIHAGRMFAMERGGEVIKRLGLVNSMSDAEATRHIMLAFEKWRGYPENIRLDWSLLAKRYSMFLSDSEIAASLASEIKRF